MARVLAGAPAEADLEPFESGGDDDAEFALALADQLAEASAAGRGGHTIVLLEPAAEATEVALVLEHVLDARRPMPPVAIRDVVAVSSVREIMSVLVGAGEAVGVAEPMGPDEFGAPGRLARRLEFASVIVLADADADADAGAGAGADAGGGHPPAGAALARAFLARLTPFARVLSPAELAAACAASDRRGPRLLVRGRAHRLGATMGWQRELAGGAPAGAAREAIGSHVFRDPRPFHPERLHQAVSTELVPARVGRILRSRGFVRLASRPGRVGSWATAGEVLDLDPTSMLSWNAESPLGQELVFFGLGLDRAELDGVLADCLLTPAELEAGPADWAAYPDPFPEWLIEHHH